MNRTTHSPLELLTQLREWKKWEAVMHPAKMAMGLSGQVFMTLEPPALKYKMKKIWNMEARLMMLRIEIMNY